MKHAKELPGNVWISLMDEAVKNGMMKAQLTGGEAMLHPDFDRIYLHLYSQFPTYRADCHPYIQVFHLEHKSDR